MDTTQQRRKAVLHAALEVTVIPGFLALLSDYRRNLVRLDDSQLGILEALVETLQASQVDALRSRPTRDGTIEERPDE
jgi:hypothetical protein